MPNSGCLVRRWLTQSDHFIRHFIGHFRHQIYYGYYDTAANKLTMFICPTEQCCESRCRMLGENECAHLRDPSYPLCSVCVPGKCELLFSPNCGSCNTTNWGLLFGSVLLYTNVYLYLHHAAKSDASTLPVSQAIVTKCLLYFYQTLPLLLSSGSMHAVFLPMVTVFSLKASDSTGGGSLCEPSP